MLFPASLPFTRSPKSPDTHLSVSITREKLDWGDYAIRGWSHLACIERKWSVSELMSNLLGDSRRRAADAFARLRDKCRHPAIYLDMRWSDIYNCRLRGQRVDSHAAIDLLMQMAAAYGFTILGPMPARTLQTRRYAGQFLLRWLLAHTYPLSYYTTPEPVSFRACNSLTACNLQNDRDNLIDIPPPAASLIVPERRRPPAVNRRQSPLATRRPAAEPGD